MGRQRSLGGMRDRDLYAQILGMRAPWKVTEVDLDTAGEAVEVHVRNDAGPLCCPECGKEGPRHDHRERRWRHLDTCQFRTILVADVPRVRCAEHGVRQIEVPWAEPGSSFTALFESLVIDWLLEASLSAVARRLRLTWDQVDGIMERAVRRGLARRGRQLPSRIGIDETSFQKHHEFVTVVTDLDRGKIVEVIDTRRKEALERYYETLDEEQLGCIQVVAMDMWQAYINATRKYVPDAESKIAFDKFHVAQMLTVAVNEVRIAENRRLVREGDDQLKGTRWLWVQNPDRMSEARWTGRFEALRESTLKTARAWGIKELAMTLWDYVRRGPAEKAWKKWLAWALRCRLKPMRKVAKSIRSHLWGILNAIMHRVTNAKAEAINSRIQWLKKRACGYRNRKRFRNAIYFHQGGLDLHPRPRAAHTIS